MQKSGVACIVGAGLRREGATDYENSVEELSLEVTETVELSLNSVIGLTRQAP